MPNAAVVSRRSASISRLNGTTGSRIASPSPTSTRSQRPRAETTAGPRHRGRGHHARHRHRDGQPAQPGDLVADPLGQQDVGRPAARRRPARTPTPTRSTPPCHGSVSSTTPTAGEQPARAAPAPGPRHRDAQRPEELQRARGAQREPGDGGHEQQRERGRHDAERDRGEQPGPAERRDPRPHQHQQDRRGPRQPQPGGALGADPVDQADGDGQPELHAHHRDDGERGAGGGRRREIVSPVQ